MAALSFGLLNGSTALADEVDPPPSSASTLPPQRHVGAGLFSGWKTAHLVEGGLFGLEPRVVRTIAPRSAPATDGGALVDTHLQIVMASWYPDNLKTLRFSFDGGIGADSSGFAGRVAHDGMAGFRFTVPSKDEGRLPSRLTEAPGYRKVDDDLRSSLDSVFAETPHAIVARAGYHVHALGDQAFYDSRVELPRLEIGYAYDGGSGWRSMGLEARAEGGLALASAFHVGDAERRLGATVAWGGRLLLHASELLHAEIAFSRLEDPRSKIGTPVDTVDARSCVRIGQPAEHFADRPSTYDGQKLFLAVCGVFRVESGDMANARGEIGRASAANAGVLLSFPWIGP